MSYISEIHGGFISNDLYTAAPLSALNHKTAANLKESRWIVSSSGGNIVHFTLVRKQNNCFVFFPPVISAGYQDKVCYWQFLNVSVLASYAAANIVSTSLSRCLPDKFLCIYATWCIKWFGRSDYKRDNSPCFVFCKHGFGVGVSRSATTDALRQSPPPCNKKKKKKTENKGGSLGFYLPPSLPRPF